MTAVWLACLLAAGGQASAAYRIQGRAVSAGTGQPVAGARVTIAPAARGDQRMEAASGDDGRFAFTGLPPGKYELAGRRRGLLAAHAEIVTGPGLDSESVILRLPPPATLSGRVVDEAGEPIAQASVQLLVSEISRGRRQLTLQSTKRTDDTGEYRFAALPAGRYYLVVSAVPWYAKFAQTVGAEAPASITHAGYGLRYYPNAAEPAAAEPLILKAGQEAAANFTLLPVPAAAVHVHCEAGEDLAKHYTLTAAGLAGNPVTIREGSMTGDMYNFWGVPPGHYTLQAEATDGGRTWYAVTEFDSAADETDVSVTLHPAPSLSGVVAAGGGAGLPAQLTILLRDQTGRSVALPASADGRFAIPAIPPGRYRVSIAGADEYYLRNREGETLDIAAGAAVRLSLTVFRATGRVAGTVYRGGNPQPGALVVLSSSNRATETSSDGSYEFRGVPPGEYALFAVEDGADLEYANPAAIRLYLGNAKKVRVGAGGTDGADKLRLDVEK